MAQYNINFSTNASKAAEEISRVNKELTQVIKIGQSIKLNLDTSSLSKSINTTFNALNKEIDSIQKKLSKLQIGGKDFRSVSASLGFREGRRERGELISQPYRLRGQAQSFEKGSNIRLQKELQALRIEASQIAPNTIEWINFQQQIARVNSELKRSDKLAEDIQLRENLGAFAPGSLAQLETKLALLKNKAREITPNTTGWKQLNKEIQQLEGGIARANKKPLTAGQRAGAAGGAFLYGGGLGGGVGSALGGIAGGLAGGVPGAFAGAAVGQAVDNLIGYSAAIATTTAEINKSKIALAGVTKNVNDYDFALKTARDAGDKFLIPITEAARKFTKLQASVVGAGFDTETTAKTFNAISAAIIATGGSTEDLNGALTATAQVFSKGKVTAEELRGQIGERLPGAFTIFAQSIGKTPQQLDKALQDGEVSLGDFIKFVEELGKRYSTTAEELANAPENAGARLKVSLEAASASYGTFFQIAGAGFQNYATALVNFAIDNESTIKSVLASFVVLAEDLVSILSKVVKTLTPVFGSFFGYIFENFAKGINAIATLAEESQRAAGAPEQRAAKQVEKLYPNPVQRFIAGANPFSQIRKDYEDALRVEIEYDKKSSQLQDSRESRLKKYIEEFKPTKFGASLGESLSKPGGDGGQSAKQNLESYASLQDTLAKNFTQAEIDRLQSIHDQRMALQNEFFNQQEARANSFQKESIKFQRELAAIENERKSALLKASLEVMKAQGSVAGGAPAGMSTSGATGLMQGSTGVSSGPHFDVRRQDGSYISPEQARALFDPSVRKQLAMTSAYGPRRAPVPGASTFHRGVDLAGPANTPLNLAAGYTMMSQGEKGGLGYAASIRGPQGEMYDVGHLQRPKAGAGAPRKVPASEKRDLVAAQQVQIANSQEIATSLSAEELAYEKTKTAIANYVASIFSPEEQALQNSLLAKRGELIRAGMDEDAIELEMKRYEIQEKVNIGLEDAKKLLDGTKEGQKKYNDVVAQLNNLLPTSNKLLDEQNALLQNNAYQKRIADLREEIKLLLIINDEQRRLAELTKEFKGDKAKAQEVFDLEKIKENIEKTRALIGDFVSSTSSDYKGFLKAVISGEDAVDALKQFQEGLTDKVLTIFLDFAMAPIDKFFKESLEKLFLPDGPQGAEGEGKKETPMDANTTATQENTTALKELSVAISDAAAVGGQATGLNAALESIGGVAFNAEGNSTIDTSIEGWSAALTANISDSIKESTSKVNSEGTTFKDSLGKVVGAIGVTAGSIMGIAAGVSQIKEGGTANVLGGIGSILMGVGGGISGFGSLFKLPGFADGGMVTGPTLGLIGEGKYNEAIVPLPDGRSIPVQFNQQSSLREAMAGSSNNTSAPSVLSMTFESTNINGVEYVSRDQLEQAMAQTRRQASRDGAQRGMTMTLDKLQQSPSTRSRLGMR